MVLSLTQFLMDPGVPITLGTYNVIIYRHSMVVLGEQLESKFPKYTGNKSYVAWVLFWWVFFFLLFHRIFSDSSF